MPKSKDIPALTGVRGYAAAWVLVMHYTWGAGYGGEGLYYQLAKNGFSGVIVFLVLSGFILSYRYRDFGGVLTGFKYRAFLFARFARVWPLHITCLIAFSVLVYYGVFPLGWNDNIKTFVLNVFLIHAWGATSYFSWNQLSWTISVELFAYILFPFVASSLFRLPRVCSAAIAIACIYIVAKEFYPHFLQYLGFNIANRPLAFGQFLLEFTLVFVSGVSLFRFINSTVERPGWQSDALVCAGLVVLFCASVTVLRVWVMMIGSLLIIAGLYFNGNVGKALFGNPVSVYLGEISYALYLTHHMLNIAIYKFYPLTNLPERLIMALIFAAVVHHLIEQPARILLRSVSPSVKPLDTIRSPSNFLSPSP